MIFKQGSSPFVQLKSTPYLFLSYKQAFSFFYRVNKAKKMQDAMSENVNWHLHLWLLSDETGDSFQKH